MMARFAQLTKDKFAADAYAHVLQNHAEYKDVYNEDELKKKVDAEIAQAHAYGIDKRDNIFRYIDMVFIFGPDLTANPLNQPLLDILNEPMHEDKKMHALMQQAEQMAAG